MKSTGRNYLKILLVILLSSGLIYAFYNVVHSRIQSQENLEQVETVTGSLLKSVNNEARMECRSSVFLKSKEEDKPDASQDVELIHDFAHKRLYIGRGEKTEIIEYKDGEPNIYSKGISPVYSKDDVKLKAIPKDRWYNYAGEQMYGLQWRRGKSDQVSYGYLEDENCLLKIKKTGKETIDEKNYTKYEAVIKNPLRSEKNGKESDNEFRKTLSAHGLNVLDLKKEYPEVYKMLKDTYNRDTEEMYIWLDENGNMARIEKDHTFWYYLEVMKENPEKIAAKVGQYGYPRVYCRQNYKYSPDCRIIEIPRDFGEL